MNKIQSVSLGEVSGEALAHKIGDLQVAIAQSENAELALRAEIERTRAARKAHRKELTWAKARRKILQNAALRLQQLDEGL